MAGNAIRWDPTSQTYVKALADSAYDAEVLGVVESIDGTAFSVVYFGEIDLSSFSPSLDLDAVYYLSPTTAGLLTTTPPTSAGHVIKPVLVRRGNNVGIVINYLGVVIGGEATVDLSQLEPLGSVKMFCGATANIPEQWSLCDGGKLDTATYADYATAIGIRFGYKVSTTLVLTSTNGSLSYSINDDVSSVLVDRIVTQGSVQGIIESATFVSTNNYAVVISEYPLFSEDRDEVCDARIDDGSLSITLEEVGYFTGTLTNTSLTHVGKPMQQGRVPIGTNYDDPSPRDFSLYSLGDLMGLESVDLDGDELPTHSHVFTGITTGYTTAIGGTHGHDLSAATSTVAGGDSTIQGVAGANIGIGDYATNPISGLTGQSPLIKTAGGHNHGVTITPFGTIGDTGGGNPHENRQPSIAYHFIVRVKPGGRASLGDLSEILDIGTDDLSDCSTSGATTGDMLLHDGTNFVPYKLFEGYTSTESLFRINAASGNISVGSTGDIAKFLVSGNTAQFVIIDADATSSVTAGGHVLESKNGLLVVYGCQGGTTFAPLGQAIVADILNQSFGIRTGFTANPAGLLDVRVSAGGTCYFNVGTGGHVVVGLTANAASLNHKFAVVADGTTGAATMAVVARTNTVAGTTMGAIYLGTMSSTGDRATAIQSFYAGLSGTSVQADLQISVNNGNGLTNGIYIRNDANVGIGITGPMNKLTVSGPNATIRIIAGSTHMVIGGSSPVIGTTGQASFALVTNNTARMTVGSTGNVGVGTTDPNAFFHLHNSTSARSRITSTGCTLDLVADGATGASIVVESTGGFSIVVGGSTRLKITSGGLVGIGVAAPAQKLEITGGVKSWNTPLWGIFNEAATGLTGFGIVSVAKTGTGNYRITHNLNNADYAVIPAVHSSVPLGSTGGLIAFLSSKSGNTFDLQVRNFSGNTSATNLDAVAFTLYQR